MTIPNSTKAFQIANNPDFQKRVLLLAPDVATDILSEANTVAHHDARAKYALKLLGPAQREEAARLAFVIAADNLESLAAVSDHLGFSDAATKTALSAAWNHVSGVYTPEPQE